MLFAIREIISGAPLQDHSLKLNMINKVGHKQFALTNEDEPEHDGHGSSGSGTGAGTGDNSGEGTKVS